MCGGGLQGGAGHVVGCQLSAGHTQLEPGLKAGGGGEGEAC